MKKIDRDLILLPNDRYGVVAFISIYFELLMGCPDREFQGKVGKNREIEKNQKNF